jgi:hypothetical protein
MRRLWLPMLLLFCGAVLPAEVRAGGLRIALLADTEVQGDTILLANLLPPNAPGTFQNAAATIFLGTVPQSGSVRRFSRDAIAAAIEAGGLPLSSFTVPEFMIVRRAGRVLTREEIFAAIQTTLNKGDVAKLPEFQPEDLVYAAAIAVPDGDARLEVTQIHFDEVLERARFRLRPQAAPGARPFYVTTSSAPRVSAKAFPRFQELETLAASRNLSSPGATVLVDPRQSARLHLHSRYSDMTLAVRPLERGHLGETIRVRLRQSGKTLQARVVGNNSVDAVF